MAWARVDAAMFRRRSIRPSRALRGSTTPSSAHFCDSSQQARANEQVLKQSLGRGQVRSREQIARFFDGLDLVEPGLVYLPEWRPDEPVRRPLDPGSTLMLGGVGRKPRKP